jgi:hypothetical protein
MHHHSNTHPPRRSRTHWCKTSWTPSCWVALMSLLHSWRFRADSCPLANEQNHSDFSHQIINGRGVPSSIQSSQLEEDFRSDAEDLRKMLRSVLLTASQAATLICLTVCRSWGRNYPKRWRRLSGLGEVTQKDGDTLRQDFFESGIDALTYTSLPNW